MSAATAPVEEVDVLIIGAGISGIGAGRYLTTELPQKTFTIVEARDVSGGTWELFKYPGIRSDSDLHTFGYEFKPWTDRQSIADAPRILDYLHETIAENGLTDKIRYGHKVISANWSSAGARWTVEIDRADGERIQITASWIFSGAGYYNYDEGFTPEFAGRDDFTGQIIHPQHWPEDLDYTGKKVVVIGSGATAVTILPSMAAKAGHVTMLQRTPTYIMPIPREDPFANLMRRILPEKPAYAISREKNIAQQRLVYEFAQRFPTLARKAIRTVNKKFLPKGYAVGEHFNPPYNPWDQRLCAVPNGDLFKTLREGSTSIVTDRITRFTEKGILLESGNELEADIIVTATGLNIQLLGGMDLYRDGEKIDMTKNVAFRGLMFSGVPNLAIAIGYTNSSWTLKVGLLCEYFCRVLAYMDASGYDAVEPVAPEGMQTRPLLDFGAGYVKRALDRLPQQGVDEPWTMSMNYYADRKSLRKVAVDESELHYSTSAGASEKKPTLTAVGA